ncbi:MAG: DUF2516 family protein [Actinomycetota bacterium]|nr:DUF2516 family protein [Actinomycetota bacterium]
MNLGGPEVIILLFVAGVVAVWAFFDAALRPGHQWRAADQSKGLWLIIIAATWFCGLGLVGGLVYLFAVRPKLKAAAG